MNMKTRKSVATVKLKKETSIKESSNFLPHKTKHNLINEVIFKKTSNIKYRPLQILKKCI